MNNKTYIILLVSSIMCQSSSQAEQMNYWQAWLKFGGSLLDTPEKAVDFTEAVVRARYGQAEVEEERPFVVRDHGETWEVRGTNGGSHLIGVVPAISAVTVRKNTGEIINYEILGTRPAPG